MRSSARWGCPSTWNGRAVGRLPRQVLTWLYIYTIQFRRQRTSQERRLHIILIAISVSTAWVCEADWQTEYKHLTSYEKFCHFWLKTIIKIIFKNYYRTITTVTERENFRMMNTIWFVFCEWTVWYLYEYLCEKRRTNKIKKWGLFQSESKMR